MKVDVGDEEVILYVGHVIPAGDRRTENKARALLSF
jgi:hypothetical protein